jgi:hypothetical protein
LQAQHITLAKFVQILHPTLTEFKCNPCGSFKDVFGALFICSTETSVAGLSYDTNETALKDAFSQNGGDYPR